MKKEDFLATMQPGTRLAIEEELQRARAKFPWWPYGDYIIACAIVAEESGEAIRAALQCRYEGGSVAEIHKELIQTAAMCIRAIEETAARI